MISNKSRWKAKDHDKFAQQMDALAGCIQTPSNISTEDTEAATSYEQVPSPEKQSPEKLPQTGETLPPSPDGSDSESTISSISSIASYDAQTAADDIPWFIQPSHGKPSLIHIIEDEEHGRLLPVCKGVPFASAPEARGFGVRQASTMGETICNSCLKKQPTDVQLAILQILK